MSMDLHLRILIPKILQRTGWKTVEILPLTGRQEGSTERYTMETPQTVFWHTEISISIYFVQKYSNTGNRNDDEQDN